GGGRGQRTKRCRADRAHTPWGDGERGGGGGKTACSVRRGGGWRRVHGGAVEAPPEETGSTSYARPTGYRASPRPYLRGESGDGPQGTAPGSYPTGKE